MNLRPILLIASILVASSARGQTPTSTQGAEPTAVPVPPPASAVPAAPVPAPAATSTTPTAPAATPAPAGVVVEPAPGPAPKPATPVFDEDPPPRLSLPTESDRELWRKPGFRFGLGLVYGRLYGVGGPPDANLIGPTIRLGVRLDEAWSLMGSLQYLYGLKSGKMNGLRFAGTIEPTWHATRHLSLAIGLGFAGLVEPSTLRPDPDPKGSTLDSSYTFPSARTPLPSCTGVGAAGLLRGQWLMVMGPRMSTGLALQFDGQWTGCVDDTGRVEPDSATPIVRRQWWPHLGGSLTWEIQWR
jgi:hypothetical protein